MLPGPAFVKFIAPVLLGLVAVLGSVLSTNQCTVPGKRSRNAFEDDLVSDLLEGVEERVHDILARLAGPRTYNMRPGVPHGSSGGIPRNLLLLRELLLLLRRDHKLLLWHRHQVVVRRESIQIIKSLRMSVIIPQIEIKALRKGILALPASTVHQSRTRGKQKKEEDSARNVR